MKLTRWNAMVLVWCLVLCGQVMGTAASAAPAADAAVVIFDSAGSPERVGHYTQSWIEGSNLKPVGRMTENKGQRLLAITYEGNRGRARTAFDCRGTFSGTTLIRGVRLTFASNLPEHGKLHVELCFSDQTAAVFAVPTRPGMNSYDLVTPHFRTSSQPMDWQKITFVCLDNDDPKRTLLVRRVELMTDSRKQELSTVKFSTLPVGEVVPDRFLPLSFPAGCPLQAQVKLDDDALVLKTRSAFGHRPLAKITEHDDSVFVDEALEIFFSPELDNRSFRQFVVNGLGTVFDLKFGFDGVAASFIYQKSWTLPHEKRQRYTGTHWENELRFPLKHLLDPSGRQPRLLGFQLVQDYAAPQAVKPIWSPATYYPTPSRFGLLTFNRQAFGKGKIAVGSLKSMTGSSSWVRLVVTLAGTDLPAGDYAVHMDVVSPLYERHHSVQRLTVRNRSFVQDLICSLPSQNGTYNLYVTLENAAGSRTAAAVSFVYSSPLRSRFGEAILCPEPKQVRVSPGVLHLADCGPIQLSGEASERTRQTAEMMMDEVSRYTGKAMSGKKGFRMSIARKGVVSGRTVTLRPEGYVLKVSPDGVDLVGADEPGLFYGTRTLMQLATSPGRNLKALPVSATEILDWPDTPNRIFRLPHPDMFRGMSLKDFRGVDYLLRDIERFVVAQKFNVFELDITSMTRFQRQPEFNGPERVFTLSDWSRIARFCRDRFIRFVPALQVGGHEDVWFLGYHPNLRMPGYANTGDVRNPKHNQIVLNCMDDLLDATQPELFLVKADEWYQTRKASEPGLTAKEYREAFIRCLKLCHRHLQQRGVRMAVFDDMFNPRTNGIQFDIYKTLDQLPKDVLILHWGGMPVDASVDYFVTRGYEVWASLTSVTAYSLKSRRRLGGYGTATYGAGRYYELRKPIGDSCSSVDSAFYGADYGWNLLRENHPTFISKIADGTFPALRERASFQPVPQGTERISPLKLENATSTLSDFLRTYLPGTEAELPVQRCSIGNIPMTLGTHLVELPVGKTLRVATMETTCASLYFLLGAWVKPHTLEELNRRAMTRQWQYGRPAGDFIITYDDGTRETVPLRHQENFDLLDTHPLNRSTMWNRCVWPIKTRQDGYLFLYQFQWVNPSPGKMVSTIEFKHLGIIDYRMILMALSAEEAQKLPRRTP